LEAGQDKRKIVVCPLIKRINWGELEDKDKKILRERIHGASRPAANRSLDQLLTSLNESEIIYPGTDMRMCYELGVKNW